MCRNRCLTQTAIFSYPTAPLRFAIQNEVSVSGVIQPDGLFTVLSASTSASDRREQETFVAAVSSILAKWRFEATGAADRVQFTVRYVVNPWSVPDLPPDLDRGAAEQMGVFIEPLFEPGRIVIRATPLN